MKRKIRKRKGEFPISCSYCIIFCTSKNRVIRAGEGSLAFSRYCSMVEDRVIRGTKSCSSFIPYSYFWCDKQDYWMQMKACLSRDTCKGRLAKNCKQQHLIKRINYGG